MFQLEGGSLFTTSWLICNPAVKVTVLWKGLADVASSELRLAAYDLKLYSQTLVAVHY